MENHSYKLELLGRRNLKKRTWLGRSFSNMRPGSLRGSIFTFLSGVNGAGILYLPLAIKESGLVLGVFFLILIALSFSLYYRVLLHVLDESGENDYIEIVAHYLGKH